MTGSFHTICWGNSHTTKQNGNPYASRYFVFLEPEAHAGKDHPRSHHCLIRSGLSHWVSLFPRSDSFTCSGSSSLTPSATTVGISLKGQTSLFSPVRASDFASFSRPHFQQAVNRPTCLSPHPAQTHVGRFTSSPLPCSSRSSLARLKSASFTTHNSGNTSTNGHFARQTGSLLIFYRAENTVGAQKTPLATQPRLNFERQRVVSYVSLPPHFQGWGLIDLHCARSTRALPRLARCASKGANGLPLPLLYRAGGAKTVGLVDDRTRSSIMDAFIPPTFPLGVAGMIPTAPRRTSTFLSCAFREQRDRPSHSLSFTF